MHLFRLLLLFGGLIATSLVHGQQTSTGPIFNPKIRYVGDSIKLKAMTDPLRGKKAGNVLGEKEKLCVETIIEVPREEEAGPYTILHIRTGTGFSCKANTKIMIYKGNQFLGRYITDIVAPKRYADGKLYCEYESGLGYVIDLSKGIPEKILGEIIAAVPFSEFKK